MWYDGSFLKLNDEMLMKWLRAAGDDWYVIHVLISSYSEMAEDENTASVVRALVCV